MPTPDDIKRQRELGWPDFHPEDYCHKCGGPNVLWHVNSNDWHLATDTWANETGREGICCPSCFASMHAEATGERTIWELQKWTPMREADVDRIARRVVELLREDTRSPRTNEEGT